MAEVAKTGGDWPRRVALGLAGAGAALYASDCMHVYGVLAERKALEESFDPERERDTLDEIAARYENDAAAEARVDPDVFRKRQAAEEQARRAARNNRLQDLEVALKIQRESSNFLGGGRAALLQLAHPYVAAGIAAHSNLGNGVQERFYRTFKYMFAMIFGDVDEALKASRVVRKLHDKVKGTVREDVGILRKDSTFDASHSHALLWVHLTLTDTSVLMYELTRSRLSVSDKDEFVRATNVFATGMFGVPQELLPADWAQFERLNNAVTMSPLIAAGETAQKVDAFLWTPPSPRFWPLLALTRWQTFVMLPSKLAKGFYGREQTKLDLFLWSLLLGHVRFVYRLLPGCARWLSAYLRFERDNGVQRSRLEQWVASLSAAVANVFLATVMPPRSSTKLG